MSNSVSLKELRSWLKAKEWTAKYHPANQDLLLLNSSDESGIQIAIHTNAAPKDLNDQLFDAVRKLSKIYGEPELEIIKQIKQSADDVLKLRFFDPHSDLSALTLEEAIAAVNGAKKLLENAAAGALHPKTYFTGNKSKAVKDFMQYAQFRHTEQGSFVMNISTPFDVNGIQTAIGEEEIEVPFSRKVLGYMNNASAEIDRHFRTGDLEEFIQRQAEEDKPILSYNFLDSLRDLFEEKTVKHHLNLEFKWSFIAEKQYHILPPQSPSLVKFTPELIVRVDEYKKYLAPPKPSMNAVFYGTVEELKGDEVEEGEGRAGDVVMALVEHKNVKVELNQEQYKIAMQAHEIHNGTIRLEGKLIYEAKGKRIVDLESFVLAN